MPTRHSARRRYAQKQHRDFKHKSGAYLGRLRFMPGYSHVVPSGLLNLSIPFFLTGKLGYSRDRMSE